MAALLATASAACAFGLGKPPDLLTLGEAFDVSIPLRLESNEDVPDSCVTADVYFGEDKLAVGALRTKVERAPSGDHAIRITSNLRIHEPVVSIYLAVGCTTRVSRKYVVLADPPVVSPSVAAAPAPAEAAGGRSASADGTGMTSPVVDRSGGRIDASPVAPIGNAAPTRPRRHAQAGAGSSADATSDEAPATKMRAKSVAQHVGDGMDGSIAAIDADRRGAGRSARKSRSVVLSRTAPVAKAGGAHLQLDPVESLEVLNPNLRLSLEMKAAPAEQADTPAAQAKHEAALALWRALNATPEDMARDRQRLLDLEARLARLQKDTSGAQQSVVELQSRVAEARAQRTRNPLVFVLAGLCAALAAALAWLLWKRREERAAQWWADAVPASSPLSDEAPSSLAMAEPAVSADASAASEASIQSGQTAPPGLSPGLPAGIQASEHQPVPDGSAAAGAGAQPSWVAASVAAGGIAGAVVAAASRAPGGATVQQTIAEESRREVSVEELIDLEQQAEFFMVLGQDQSAIDLLESHIHSTFGSSPLPYLKLLELYRRVDDRERYEATRESFNGRFNAYAPSWDADPQQGHTLADYPGVVERLQALWTTPDRAMVVLQASLLKREPADETFDLPAYRELLLLYAVARDLSEKQSQEAVDLLLPIEESAARRDDVNQADESVEPLTATRPVKAYGQAPRPLTVDLSLPDLAPTRSGVPVDVTLDDAALGRGSQDSAGSIDFESSTDAPGPDAIRRGGGLTRA